MKRKLNIFLTLLIIGNACSKNMQQIDIQGHRGCRGIMPENTIAAMYKAIDLNVNTLEMDVIISQDGKVVVSHDSWFSHEIALLPNGDSIKEADEKLYNLYKMNYDIIVKYDVGSKSHPRFPIQQKMKVYKPLLSDLIDSVKNYCLIKGKSTPYFNIEIKSLPDGDNLFHPVPELFVKKVMDIILSKKIENLVIIQSFDYRNLEIMHKQYPNITTSMLVEEDEKGTIKDFLAKLSYTPNIISPHYKLINKDFATYCKQHNIKMIPWTVNDIATAKELVLLGVDGIITDYPNNINTLTVK